MKHSNTGEVILFFDGICGICNRFVRFVLKHDQSQNIKFAPLQGQTALRLLAPELRENMPSLVLVEGDVQLTHSDAALRLLCYFGGAWRALGLLRYIPRPLRDGCYNAIARMRYRIFGKVAYCAVSSAAGLSEAAKARFLP